MKTYGTPLRDWFLPQAFVPSYFGAGLLPEELTKDFKKHIDRCGAYWASEPHVGSVAGFAGEDEPDDSVLGVVARVFCTCGRYGASNVSPLFVPGRDILRELITKIAEGGKP